MDHQRLPATSSCFFCAPASSSRCAFVSFGLVAAGLAGSTGFAFSRTMYCGFCGFCGFCGSCGFEFCAAAEPAPLFEPPTADVDEDEDHTFAFDGAALVRESLGEGFIDFEAAVFTSVPTALRAIFVVCALAELLLLLLWLRLLLLLLFATSSVGEIASALRFLDAPSPEAELLESLAAVADDEADDDDDDVDCLSSPESICMLDAESSFAAAASAAAFLSSLRLSLAALRLATSRSTSFSI